MEVPQKTKNRTTMSSSDSSLGYVSENLKTLIQTHTCTHIHVHSSSQDMEATQVSINGQMDKEDVVHTHTQEYYLAIRKRMKLCHFQQHGWT